MSLQSRPLALALAGFIVPVVLLAACGGGEVTPPAENPTPDIAGISPGSAEVLSAGGEFTLTGSDFVPGSVVRVNGAGRPTTFVSRAQLKAALPASDFMLEGSLQLQVFNPAPGGGTSQVVSIAVVPPAVQVPTIGSVTPAFLMAGSSSGTVTITGTGFGQHTRVTVDNASHPGRTVTSATSMQVTFTAAQLAKSAVLQLGVVNDGPGGGMATRTVEVSAPGPAATSLSVTTTEAGQAQLVLRVTGIGFIGNSSVLVNWAPRPTTYVNGTTLDVVVPGGDLAAAGILNISVSNPAPGGGMSGALQLTVVNGTPAITELPSQGAVAGASGFSLSVHGRGFVPTSVVHWNGAARPTQYVSGTRLVATISAADVAAPATSQVAVHTPAPGGGTSAPHPFSARTAGSATATSVRRFTFHATDLAMDAARGVLYLSIPQVIPQTDSGPADANSIVAVDPATGAVTKRVFVGNNPARIAMSGDGQLLHVGLNDASAVRRVALSSFTATLQWLLPPGEVAGEILALPGRPGSVVISRQVPTTSPPLRGVTVYDDGVARPQSTPGHTGGNRLAILSSADTVYGFNNAGSWHEFFTIVLDPSGARHATTSGSLVSGFYTQITGAAGRIYGSDGSVVDAERRVKVGTLAIPAGNYAHAVMVDPALGRAFLPGSGGIAVYDLNTFQYLGTVPVPEIWGAHPAGAMMRIVRWSADGLAFLDLDELFLVRSPLFGP